MRDMSCARGPLGVLLVTITAFPEEVKQLEELFWSKLDSVLRFEQRENANKQLPPRGQLFPFGTEKTTIEMWQEWTWYHWKVVGSAPDTKAVEGKWTKLPRRNHRFWQAGRR